MYWDAVLALVSIAASPLVGQFIVSDVYAASQALTITDVRAQFNTCGFDVGNPGTPSNSQYLVLRDDGVDVGADSNYRIVMAIVYRDAEAALVAHQAAHHRAERVMGRSRAFTDDNGPQLLAGYGGSVWRNNVALVESDTRTLNSMYAYETETDEVTIAWPELFKFGFVSSETQYAVDRDVVDCLENVVPVFLQQQAW